MTIVGLVDRGGMPHPPPGATVNPLLPRQLPDAHLGRLAEDRQRVAGADEDPPGGDGGGRRRCTLRWCRQRSSTFPNRRRRRRPCGCRKLDRACELAVSFPVSIDLDDPLERVQEPWSVTWTRSSSAGESRTMPRSR